MINPLPLLSGLAGNPAQGSGQTGEIWVEETVPSSGKLSDTLFAKILREQSMTLPQSNIFPRPDPSVLPGLLFDFAPWITNAGRSPQDGPGIGIPATVVEAPVSLESEVSRSAQDQLYPSPLPGLETDDHMAAGRTDVIASPVLPLALLEAYGRDHVEEVNIPEESNIPEKANLSVDQVGARPLVVSSEGPSVSAVSTFPVSIAGDLLTSDVRTNDVGTPFSNGTAVSPVVTGFSSIQASSAEIPLADKSAAPIIPDPDPQSILREALKQSSQPLGPSEVKPVTGAVQENGQALDHPDKPRLGSAQDEAPVLVKVPTSSMGPLQEPFRPFSHQAFQAPLPFEATPADLDEAVQTNQSRIKVVNGTSSLLNEIAGSGKESSPVIPSDLRGDSPLSLTGDRSRDALESIEKNTGLDSNGSQGFNNGTGGSPHSQSGSQQPSTSLSQGSGVRIAEERAPDAPAPALQRLQMDVQISESNRIQIDVGVQNRQVYAGLLLDHPSLKNLAVQFVPQLEEQLAHADMDLQEFSAEVRDHHGNQESDTPSQRSESRALYQGTPAFSHSPDMLPSLKRGEDAGMHLVA